MKPLIIIGSARKQSHTLEFVETLMAGTEVVIADLLDHTIAPYDYSGHYPPADTFQQLVELMLSYRLVIFATPVYWYSMSGHMKMFFDRLTDLVTINKPTGRRLKELPIALVAVGTDDELPPGFEKPFELTCRYLDMKYLGAVYHSTKHAHPTAAEEYVIQAFRKKLSPLS